MGWSMARWNAERARGVKNFHLRTGDQRLVSHGVD
jgi:hypothetical protein